MTDTKSTAKGACKYGEEEKERDRRGRLLRSGEGRGERLYRRARQIGAPAPVILSEAKNLFSCLKGMA